MKRIRFTLVVVFVLTTIFSCVKFRTADLVIHNARIYTVNETFEVAQAMAIKDGKIIAIGKEHEIMNKYRPDEIIDAETRPIYPGFMDAHCHFLGSGLNSLAVDLSEVKTIMDLENTIEKYKNDNPDSRWIVGYGWDENNWNFTTVDANRLINRKFDDKAVMLWRVDGHSLLANLVAIVKANYSFFKLDSGIISEEDIPLFVEAINYTKAQKKQALRYAQQNFFSKGVTTVSDAGLSLDEVELIKMMQESGTLDMNVYAMLYGTPDALNFDTIWNDKLTVNAIKVVFDGSVGSQTACFKQPYKGTNNYGTLFMTRDSLKKITELVYEKGAQLNVHCIGDSAVKVALEVMGEVLKRTNGLAWRIEHAQVVGEAEMQLFKKYSIIPSVQPSHIWDDITIAEKNLTAIQLANSYRLKSLLELNLTIPLGTDYPVATNNPIYTFYNAIYRPNQSWVNQSEILTREEALKGITFWVALANKTYENNGSLEVGKDADFVILDRDIIKISQEEIKATEVLKTFSGGQIVFENMK
jgi:predicted amidohydrolase YtcJ